MRKNIAQGNKYIIRFRSKFPWSKECFLLSRADHTFNIKGETSSPTRLEELCLEINGVSNVSVRALLYELYSQFSHLIQNNLG